MGNTVCTDVIPFTLDDIMLSHKTHPKCRVDELLSAKCIEGFAQYQHNFKAFSFFQRSTGGPALRLDSSQVYSLPVNLAQSKMRLDDTGVYMLVHVQRMPTAITPRTTTAASNINAAMTGRSDGSTPRYGERSLKDLDFSRRWGEKAPLWATAITDAFTPRGVATTFSTNIAKPLLTVRPSVPAGAGVDGYDFRYSIHVLTGVRANQVLASGAVLHAIKLERRLTENEEIIHRLFFNINARRSALDPSLEFGLSAPVGDVVYADRTPRRSPRLTEEYAKNSILRILCRVRSKSLLPTLMTTPASSRGNASRGSTPRGRMGTPTGATSFPFSFYHQQQRSGSPPRVGVPITTTTTVTTTTTTTMASGPLPQPPCGLEIPRLRFHVDTGRQYGMEPPVSAPRRSNTQTPQTSHRELNSSASNIASSRTPRTASGSPRFPVISNLRLNETLNGRTKSDLPVENDEIRMTEERMQRLKVASPQATEILSWFFVGGEEAAKDRAQLLSKGITSIINTVAFSMGNLHDDVFQYLGLYVSDSPDEPIFSLFPVVIRFVEETRIAGGKTFIHCHQGVSRSCSFVIAYMMWQKGLCYDRAFEFVRARRTVCSPNAGFYVNLLFWENQLTRPVLNKAYAYVPYSEYLFPFSFRLALSFRHSQASHEDDADAHVVNTFVRSVCDSCERYVVDSRLSYGILLGESGDNHPGNTSQGINSYFFAGKECDSLIQQQAKEDWEAFVRYSFYHGESRRSTNNKGESITFTPLPPLTKPTEYLQNINDVGRVIEESVFTQTDSGSYTTSAPKPILDHDPRWDSLLARNDIVFSFANHLAEQQRERQATSNRKRNRDEEMYRLSKNTHNAITARVSPHSSNSKNSNSYGVAAAPSTGSRIVSFGTGLTTTIAAAPAAAGVVPTVPIETSRKSSSTDSNANNTANTTMNTNANTTATVEIYAYPFTGPPLSNIIDVADMEASRCYVVLVPAASSRSSTHRVFLWIGCKCGIAESEVWRAYHSSLKVGSDVRLSSGVLLSNPREEVARDGDEPDDLIFALD